MFAIIVAYSSHISLFLSLFFSPGAFQPAVIQKVHEVFCPKTPTTLYHYCIYKEVFFTNLLCFKLGRGLVAQTFRKYLFWLSIVRSLFNSWILSLCFRTVLCFVLREHTQVIFCCHTFLFVEFIYLPFSSANCLSPGESWPPFIPRNPATQTWHWNCPWRSTRNCKPCWKTRYWKISR